MATETTERDWIEEVGAPAYAEIVERVEMLDRALHAIAWTKSLTRERRQEIWCEHIVSDDELKSQVATVSDDELISDIAEAIDDDARLGDEIGFDHDEEQALQQIEEQALSVSARPGWVTTDNDDLVLEDFEILLTTGGPAVRIRGELDEGANVHRAWLEVQDWGKSWTTYHKADRDTVEKYAAVFNGVFESLAERLRERQ